jgi:hypothetical protein
VAAAKLKYAFRHAMKRSPLMARWHTCSMPFPLSTSLLDRHVENMRNKNFVGPTPEFVRAITRASDFWLLQAMVAGNPEAGLLVGWLSDFREVGFRGG